MIEVESEILSSVIGCDSYHKYSPEYGSRAWKAQGKYVDVIYWDEGNGWCIILDVIPKKKKQTDVVKFYKKLKIAIAKNYDEDGFRRG